PSWLKSTVEILDNSFFGKLIEIDDNVPAENNVHFPEEEEPVLIIEIEPAESYKLPYPVGYPVPAILLVKVTAFVKRLGNPERGVAVDSLTSLVQDTLADIGTDYFYLPACKLRPLKKQYRYGIRLFACGTACTPYSQDSFRTCPFFQNHFRNDLVSERLQLKRLPEEICLVGGKEVHYVREFLIPVEVIPQIVVIIMECRKPVMRKPCRKASFKQESVVIGKVQTTVVVHEITQ